MIMIIVLQFIKAHRAETVLTQEQTLVPRAGPGTWETFNKYLLKKWIDASYHPLVHLNLTVTTQSVFLTITAGY